MRKPFILVPTIDYGKRTKKLSCSLCIWLKNIRRPAN